MSGVRSSLRSPCCVIEQDTFTSQKVLVIHSKRWLRPDMTEHLFTGTLSKTRNETKRNIVRQFHDCIQARVQNDRGEYSDLYPMTKASLSRAAFLYQSRFVTETYASLN